MRTWLAAAVASAALGGVPPAHAADGVTATVHHWSDGDTVVTDQGAVRLIGMNAPDYGACGYRAAIRSAERLAPRGTEIRLTNPGGVRDTDGFGRLLRYVAADGQDVGLAQIRRGSQAKYDGTDGYDPHPKQRRYRKQDIKHRDHCASHDLASYPPASHLDCPARAPIKGNRGEEWIYHLPSNRNYKRTSPEECFASEDGAKLAGYRAALS